MLATHMNNEGSGAIKLSQSYRRSNFARPVEWRQWIETVLAVCLEFVLQTTEANAEQLAV
jgi:hypothetical protein